MAELGVVVTEADVDALNRASIARAAAFVKVAGSVLVVVGAVGCAAWAWASVRTQQQISSAANLTFGGSGSPIDIDFVDRIDALTSFVALLVTSAVAVGFGLMLRLGADVVVARSGGSLTGFEPGDVVE
jgi:hypothetical protein